MRIVLIEDSYIPSGSSKFGSFTIENIDGQSILQYTLYIDGEERWTTQLSAPIVEEAAKASGSFWDRFNFV